MRVPFFRTDIGDDEIAEVTATLRSGWLTTGPRVKRFEEEFRSAVGAAHAVAVNSCTAALHLAVEALGLNRKHGVLLPAMTFAATAEVVRYAGALPILVDCDPVSLNLDLADAESKLAALRRGELLPVPVNPELEVVGLMPVHVGGLMMDMKAVRGFAEEHGLWLVEDAAHAFPAAWRGAPQLDWEYCGGGTANVTCFSFYANKTITTGEGGMATTEDSGLAERMRLMSLHGMSRDPWNRYAGGGGGWDYRIVAPGFKYNLTDLAAAVGVHQLARAEQMRRQRQAVAKRYLEAWSDLEEVELPPSPTDRLHAWHLFPLKLQLERLTMGRDEFIEELTRAGVSTSVHWRPLHLHPYYQESFGWRPEQLPAASEVWRRIISVPLFAVMTDGEIAHVIETVRKLCRTHRRPVHASGTDSS